MTEPTEPTEQIESSKDRWLLTTASLLGAVAGFAFYLIQDQFGPGSTDKIALFLFVGFAAAMGLLSLERDSWPRDAGFSLALGLLVGGLFKFAVVWIGLSSKTNDDFFVAFAVSGWALYLVPVVFYQTGRDAGGLKFPYPELFLHAWNNKLALLTAGFFLCCCWLVLALWGGLFSLLKIEFFANLFTKPWFITPFSGLVFGLGMATARERRRILEGIRRIILALFRFITPVLGFVAVIFVATLPFTGLETLWETRFATTLILAIVYLFVFALNVVIQTGDEQETLWRPAEWLVMAACLVLPVFAAIGAYALYLRIGQHGWTPDRFYAVCLIGVGGAYALAYAFCVLWRRRHWASAVTRLNPPLAAAVVAIAVLVHLPGAEPFGWSARHQVARLLDGRAKASEFDFAYLRFKLGDAGKKAFEGLAGNPKITGDPAVQQDYDKVAGLKSYRRQYKQARKDKAELKGFADYLILQPAGATAPPKLVKSWLDNESHAFRSCKDAHDQGKRQCVLLRVDLDSDGRPDAVLVKNYGSLSVRLQDQNGNWLRGPDLYVRGGKSKPKAAELLDLVRAGKYKVVPHRYSDVIIGETRFE